MSLEEQLQAIKNQTDSVQATANTIESNQWGFWTWALLTVGGLGAIASCSRTADIKDELAALKNQYTPQQTEYTWKRENVIGGQEPDVFIEYKGQRYFLEIDGKKVTDYIPPQAQPTLIIK